MNTNVILETHIFALHKANILDGDNGAHVGGAMFSFFPIIYLFFPVD